MKKTQYAITISALLIAGAHLIWPKISIDAITIALLIIAVSPWLAPFFKSVELPGGIKVEFPELERVKKEAEAAGLITDKPKIIESRYNFLDVADSHPQLALVELRIELEKALKSLAESNGIQQKNQGISFLMHDLHEKGLVTPQERSALSDMIGTLNRVAHGESLDERASAWVIDVGPQIIDTIKKRYQP